MVNQNDILAALQGGADPEAIAQNFADMLNAAIAEKAKQEEAERQAKAAAETRKEKIDWMDEILDMLNDFLKEFYPDIYDEDLAKKIEAKDVVEAFDQAYEEVHRMQPFLNDLQELVQKLEADPGVKKMLDQKKNVNNIMKFADGPVDPIAAFLKMNNL